MNPPKRIARKVLATAKNYKCLTKIIVAITWVVAAVSSGRKTDLYDAGSRH